MKKTLLLSLALSVAAFSHAAQHNIYVANCTDWGNDVALYSWGDSEIFGGWPGATPSETVTLQGIEYNKFTVSGHDGEVAHPIFNNNNKGQQVDLGDIILNAENYYFATDGITVKQFASPSEADTDFSPVSTFVYAVDNTGWDNLYLYAWADGQSDIFGGWPGTKMTDTEVINGVSYFKVPFPGNGTIAYNLIFNDGNGTQFDGPTAYSGTNLYIQLNADASFTIIEGVVPTIETPDDLYIIGNLADSNWDPANGFAFTKSGDIFTAENVVFKAVDGNEVAYFSLTSILNSDWTALDGHRFGAADEMNALIATGTTLEFKAYTAEAVAWQILPGSYDIEVDFAQMIISVKAASIAAVDMIDTDSDSQPEYFNLQGIRVAQPSEGLYIVRRGNKTSKVVL